MLSLDSAVLLVQLNIRMLLEVWWWGCGCGMGWGGGWMESALAAVHFETSPPTCIISASWRCRCRRRLECPPSTSSARR